MERITLTIIAGGDVTDTTAGFTRAVLVCNGPLEPVASARLWKVAQEPGILRVGVDGGANRFLMLGLSPHVVTGDFDSLTSEDLDRLEARGVTVVPTPDQDYTDFDKALAYVCYELGLTDIQVFGAVGGRLDHTYSVLSALIKYGRDSRLNIRLVDSIGETFSISGEWTRSGEDLIGRTLSLITLGPVSGITTTGVRWPLTHESLAPGIRDGTLNEITEPEVTVRIDATGKGRDMLLVYLHHEPLPPRRIARQASSAE